MLLYPTKESKTKFTFTPWASLVLGFLGVLGYVFVTVPNQKERDAEVVRRAQYLQDVLQAQFNSGDLEQVFFIKAKDDPSVIALPEHRDIYSEEVRKALRETQHIRLPLESIRGGAQNKLLHIITPHDPIILVVGIFCLWLMGFLFEHQYDRQLLLAIFVASGVSWILLEPYVPTNYWPSPIFAWSNTVMVLLILTWLSAPMAMITLNFRGWMIKPYNMEIELPFALVVALFTVTYVIITYYVSPYSSSFSRLSQLTVLLEGLLFSLMMMGVSTHNLEKEVSKEQLIAKKIAEATLTFEELKPEEGFEQIKEAMDLGPDRLQMSMIANLAWQNEFKDFAEQCYKNVLRKAVTSKDTVHLLNCVQEMVFRHIKVPVTFLLKAAHQAIDTNQIQEAEKLLPHIKPGKEIDLASVRLIYDKLSHAVVSKKNPDKFLLNKLKEWLVHNHPDSDALTAINVFFNRQSAVNPALQGFGHLINIHRSVDIEMVKVTTDNVYISVSGKEQRIPWTATIGFFGCHISESPKGYRGCLIIKFKRKNFVCIFTTPRILVREENNSPMSFERLWALLKSQVPEDLPFLLMRDFPELKAEAEIVKHAEEFINTHEEIEANPS